MFQVYGMSRLRRAVVQRLAEAYSVDDLSLGDYERRVAAAERASTVDELNAVLSDCDASPRIRPVQPDSSANSSHAQLSASSGVAGADRPSSTRVASISVRVLHCAEAGSVQHGRPADLRRISIVWQSLGLGDSAGGFCPAVQSAHSYTSDSRNMGSY